MPLKKRDKQIRIVTIKGRKITRYQEVQGDLWLSGYDERVSDTLAQSKLPDGNYRVSFYPYGLSKGWDAVTRLKIERMSTQAKRKPIHRMTLEEMDALERDEQRCVLEPLAYCHGCGECERVKKKPKKGRKKGGK